MASSLALAVNEQADAIAIARERLASEGARLQAFVAHPPDRPLRMGSLSGLTFAMKDMFDWAGRAPTSGLHAAPGPTPLRDAALVTALLDRGATCTGLVEMTPLAFEASGGNFERARPLNPLDATRICGGSSSGPAVAVAAGLADFAVGSDTAGSLRIPAHCCGIAAWKPSLGLLPLAGAMNLAPSFDVAGFLARDMAMLARVAAAFVADAGKSAPRIAISNDLPCADRDMMDRLAQRFGALRLAMKPILDACDPPMLLVLQAEAAREHATTLTKMKSDPTFARRMAKGLETSDAQLRAAQAEIARLRAGAEQLLFADAELILLPVMPIVTPLIAECEPGSPAFSGRTLYALAAYTRMVSALGLPALAIPAGRDANNMPVGVQILARRGADAALIAFAAQADFGVAQ